MIYDYTTLKDLACEEEFRRRHVDGFASALDAPSQVIGRAIHAGVRAYYEGADAKTIGERVGIGWGGVVVPEAAVSPNGADFRTLDLALAYTRMYQQVYPRPWGFDVLHNEGYLEARPQAVTAAVGRSGESQTVPSTTVHSLTNGSVQTDPTPPSADRHGVAGIPDRIIRRHSDGVVMPLELKTTSLFPGVAWQNQWAHNLQAVLQLELAEALLRAGAPGANADVRVSDFWLDAVYLSSRKAGPQPADFVRCGPFAYSPALRAELLAEVVRRSVRADELKAGRGAPAAKNPEQCFRYNRLCRFHRFCLLDPSEREDAYALAVATGDLTVRPWDPAGRDTLDKSTPASTRTL